MWNYNGNRRQLCSTSSFRFFEKYPTGIYVPKATPLVQPMGLKKKRELVNYIPEAIRENLLTSSSTAKEVSARTDLL
jgi:hypothetical protein